MVHMERSDSSVNALLYRETAQRELASAVFIEGLNLMKQASTQSNDEMLLAKYGILLPDRATMSVPEAARFIGASPATGWRLVAAGEWDTRRILSRTVVLVPSLLAWLERQPKKAGKSEVHRQRALRRWHGSRDGGAQS